MLMKWFRLGYLNSYFISREFKVVGDTFTIMLYRVTNLIRLVTKLF